MTTDSDLLDEHYPEVTYRYCLSVVRGITGNRPIGTQADIDDLANETAIRFALYARENTLEAPKAVLRRIARHVFSEELRKKKRFDRARDDLTQMMQDVTELPFMATSSDEPSRIKAEFLRRAFDRMSPEDRRLFNITYAHERRTMVEQAEILNKTLRAHTVQKNRFFSRLRSIKNRMAQELSLRIQWQELPFGPDLEAHDSLIELGGTENQIADYRLLIMNACAHFFFESQLFAQRSVKSAEDRVQVAHRYHKEAMRQFMLIPSFAKIQDWMFQAMCCRAISLHMAAHGFAKARDVDNFINLQMHSAMLLYKYGEVCCAGKFVAECKSVLTLLKHDHEIERLPERFDAVDLRRNVVLLFQREQCQCEDVPSPS